MPTATITHDTRHHALHWYALAGDHMRAAHTLISTLGQKQTLSYSFALFRGLSDFAGAVDKKLCDRAKCACLQGHDSVWHEPHWQANGHGLDLRAHRGKFQCGSRENRDEASARQQTHARVGRIGDYGRARIIDSVSPESFHRDRRNLASGGR